MAEAETSKSRLTLNATTATLLLAFTISTKILSAVILRSLVWSATRVPSMISVLRLAVLTSSRIVLPAGITTSSPAPGTTLPGHVFGFEKRSAPFGVGSGVGLRVPEPVGDGVGVELGVTVGVSVGTLGSSREFVMVIIETLLHFETADGLIALTQYR